MMSFRARWRGLCLAFALALGCAGAAPAAAQQAHATDRQILVMVRHPPTHFEVNDGYGGGYGGNLARSARERLAHRIAHDYGLRLVDDWPMPLIGIDCFVMVVPDGQGVGQALDRVSKDSSVAWAQPVQQFHAQGAAASHNDPLFAAQPAAAQWRLAELHLLATGRRVTVAVVDSGIEREHPDLAGQLAANLNFVDGRPFVAETHGTGVAGIIAAKADNGIGVAGVAPGARLMGLRACWSESATANATTVCDSFSLAKALEYAIERHADVINLSLSGPADPLLKALLKVGLDRGSTVVAAVDRARPDGGFPASFPGVIAVADQPLAPLPARVYIAPGRDVPTTRPGGRYYLVNGSSFAAAEVSGLVALVRERQHSGAPSLVLAKGDAGRIDACATLVRVTGPCACACVNTREAAR